MLKAGGYLVGHGPDGCVQECDSFTCGHCNRIVLVRPKQNAADVGGFCRCCTKLICGPCVDDGRCTPLEKRLEAAERRADTLRSYGMAS